MWQAEIPILLQTGHSITSTPAIDQPR